jgi:WXG100 family type VII secretion target
MTTPANGSLNTDFGLMTSVAAGIDTRNDEVRAMLRAFIGQMTSVPASVWGGVAAARFREVVDRWDGESVRLYASLQRIAETIRLNERTLREVAESHSQAITATSHTL